MVCERLTQNKGHDNVYGFEKNPYVQFGGPVRVTHRVYNSGES